MYSIAMWNSTFQMYQYLVEIDEDGFTLWSANPARKRLEFKTIEEAQNMIKERCFSKSRIVEVREIAR